MEIIKLFMIVLGVTSIFCLCLGKLLLYFGENSNSPLLKSIATIMVCGVIGLCVMYLMVF